MKTPTFPTPEEIQEAIDKINEKLALKQMNMRKNSHIKEGLSDCLRILNDRLENPENPYFIAETEKEWDTVNKIYREQLAGINNLKTQEGRAIAILCVDWLNGKVGKEIFDNFEKQIIRR